MGTHRHACPLPARGCRRVRTRLPARSAEKEAKPAAEGADSHIVEVHHMLHFLIFQKSVSGETYLINKPRSPLELRWRREPRNVIRNNHPRVTDSRRHELHHSGQ